MLIFSILALSLAAFLILSARAPRGWQDEGGFHYDPRDDSPEDGSPRG